MSQLSYTNLNPGHYTLRLREMDLYENKTVQEVQLAITIHAPFYNTPLAWIIYILSASVILYLILSARWRQIILRKTLEHEKEKEEYNQMAARFHELEKQLEDEKTSSRKEKQAFEEELRKTISEKRKLLMKLSY